MCDLASWKQLPSGKIYFMDNVAIAKYRHKHPEKSAIDCRGHAAIEEYYCCGGTDYECTDFSSPSNFPPEIVSAIKAGRMSGHGTFPEGLLTADARKLLDEDPEIKKAWSASKKAWSASKKAWSVYDEARSAHQKAWSASKKTRSAYQEAWSAYREARSVYDEARSVYGEALSKIKWKLFQNPDNRTECWR